jgi:transposase InsO family protein
LIVEILDV